MSDPKKSSDASPTTKAIIAVSPAIIAALGVAVTTFYSSTRRPWTFPVSKASILGLSLIVYMIGVVGGLSHSISVYNKGTDDFKKANKMAYQLDVANLVCAVVIAAGGLAMAMRGMQSRMMAPAQMSL